MLSTQQIINNCLIVIINWFLIHKFRSIPETLHVHISDISTAKKVCDIIYTIFFLVKGLLFPLNISDLKVNALAVIIDSISFIVHCLAYIPNWLLNWNILCDSFLFLFTLPSLAFSIQFARVVNSWSRLESTIYSRNTVIYQRCFFFLMGSLDNISITLNHTHSIYVLEKYLFDVSIDIVFV